MLGDKWKHHQPKNSKHAEAISSKGMPGTYLIPVLHILIEIERPESKFSGLSITKRRTTRIGIEFSKDLAKGLHLFNSSKKSKQMLKIDTHISEAVENKPVVLKLNSTGIPDKKSIRTNKTQLTNKLSMVRSIIAIYNEFRSLKTLRKTGLTSTENIKVSHIHLS